MISFLEIIVMKMNEKELKNKIQFFYDNKIYAYLKSKSGTFFNGYIISVKPLKFKDDLLGEKAILISDIKILDYSNKVEGGKDD